MAGQSLHLTEGVPSAIPSAAPGAAPPHAAPGNRFVEITSANPAKILKGLSGGAKTPRSLYDYLTPRVQDDARRQNREQSPTLAGSGADAAF